MPLQDHEVLAAVVALHPGRRIFGRTRLQKTIKLLQKRGLPSTYRFRNYFYGPYSDELQSDIGFLERSGLLREDLRVAVDGNPYYVIEASNSAELPELAEFGERIERLAAEADSTVLELAATFEAFEEMGYRKKEAWEKVRVKKADKVSKEREAAAIRLLDELG